LGNRARSTWSEVQGKRQCCGVLSYEYDPCHTDDLESITQSEVLKEGVLEVLLPVSTFQINLRADRTLAFGVHRWM